jgi:hypothetical protein
VNLTNVNAASLSGLSSSAFMRADGNTSTTGNITATAYFHSSDRRLKADVQDIKGLETILALHGVRYTWRKDGSPDIGLIAQEVEEILPELVTVNPETGMKAVKYGNIVAPLIEATKELHGLCQANSEVIKAVERQVSAHDERMAELESQVRDQNAIIEALRSQNQSLEQRLQRIESLIGQ